MTSSGVPVWGVLGQQGPLQHSLMNNLSHSAPDPRILVCGCGGSGNNTMNRITHIGVEGAITVAINTDKQH